ncbi:MAG: DUF6624 domain-containing protein [Alphaproteobacteria bacterium]
MNTKAKLCTTQISVLIRKNQVNLENITNLILFIMPNNIKKSTSSPTAAFGITAFASEEEKIKSRLREMAKYDEYLMYYGADNHAYADEESQGERLKALQFVQSGIAKHAEELKKILTKLTWTDISNLGAQAASDVFILVQHSDHDPAFQAKILKQMEDDINSDPQDCVYLYDRLAMNQGKPQRYGTQFMRNGEPYEIEDLANLDKRRNQAGLGSMAEYTEIMASYQPRFREP